MNKTILIMSADKMEAVQLEAMLKKRSYVSETILTIETLIAKLSAVDCLAVMLDVDSVPIDNRSIRDLTLSFPSVFFFCTSRDRFHPDLKDAICYHIYACLNKPIDPQELTFWLRSIENSEQESRGPPSDGRTKVTE